MYQLINKKFSLLILVLTLFHDLSMDVNDQIKYLMLIIDRNNEMNSNQIHQNFHLFADFYTKKNLKVFLEA